MDENLHVPKSENCFAESRIFSPVNLLSRGQAVQFQNRKGKNHMIRVFALVTVFAISLFAVPTQTSKTTNILPTPTCNPCTDPWS
jgi:hypothetical protein